MKADVFIKVSYTLVPHIKLCVLHIPVSRKYVLYTLAVLCQLASPLLCFTTIVYEHK